MPAFSGVIDDILINVLLQPIDGPGNVLGAAGACFIRTAGGLPVFGLMFFDTADLEFLETNNLLDEVIVHEMGHVLGFSSGFFNRAGLLANAGAGTTDPRVPGQDGAGSTGCWEGGPSRFRSKALAGAAARAPRFRTGTRARSSTS